MEATYYSVDRARVAGNGEDEETVVLATAFSTHWTLDSAQAEARYWRARGWCCTIEGPHDLPTGCDTTQIR